MLGPIFVREALTIPRRARHWVLRTGYPLALLVLMFTAWLAVVGLEQVRSLSDLARFGTLLFQFYAMLQMALMLFLSPLLAAGAVAHEKDRRTLILLLMTRLSSAELVLGKLVASQLTVLVLLAAGLPIFMLCVLLGGTSVAQVLAVMLLTAASALATGSLGTLIAFWRDRTFQTLALTMLLIVLYLGAVEALYWIGGAQAVAAALNPFRALLATFNPLDTQHALPILGSPAAGFVLAMLAFGALLAVVTIARIRAWNPGREEGAVRPDDEARRDERAESTHPSDSSPRLRAPSPSTHRLPSRHVWDNPVLWREIRTRTYGRRPLLIKAAYVAAFGLLVAYLVWGARSESAAVGAATQSLVPLAILSLLLVNALAVTAITSERDGGTLDLLLVTDITPREFIFGKLAGVFYNAREMILLPLALVTYFAVAGVITAEAYVYLAVGLLVLFMFAAVLGMHAGITFERSRVAIGNSLGTIFFLFVGVFICVFLIVSAGNSFLRALPSFVVFTAGGAMGLFASLGARNPSRALFLAAVLCPFLTFYAITSYLPPIEGSLGPFLAIVVAYGWATIAMLVPAVSEFDIALGRTTEGAEARQ